MLQTLRNLSKSWAFKGLMALLVVSFGIWGIGDMFRGNPMKRVVAKVGNVKITVQALEHEFQKSLPEARRVFGHELTVSRARQIGVLDRTLTMMIEQSLIDQEIERLGIKVSEKPVLEKIASQPELRDKDGKFNSQLWKQLLAKSGLTESSFITLERNNAARRLLLNTLVNDLPLPRLLVDHLYMARGAKRILEVLTISNDSMKNLDPPDEEVLREFHKQHGDIFSAPEYRSMTVVRLSNEEAAQNISISEEELKNAYETRNEEIDLPERRDFIQVILQDEAKAKVIFEAAKEKGSLVSAAKEKGLTPTNLNGIDERSVLPELYTSLFSLAENDISEPVKSSFGWHVVQLMKIHPAGKLSFEEAKDKLREILQKEKSADALAKTVNQLDDSLAAATSLEEIANNLKLKLIKVPPIDKEGIDADGNKPLDIPGKEEVISTAFSLADGEVSQVIDDKNGGYLVVRVDEIKPAHVVPFEEVMNEVFDAWKRAKKAEMAAERAEEIAKELRDGAKSISYASKPGIEVRFSKPISMLGELDPDLPAEAYEKILLMKKGDVITAPSRDKQFVLRLAEIAQVDPQNPDDNIGKVSKDLEETFSYELVEQYSKFLRSRFPVKINEELLDSLRKQGS